MTTRPAALDRRGLLALAAAAGASAAVPLAGLAGGPVPAGAARDALALLVRDPAAGVGVAAAYLRREPDAAARLGALRDRLAGLGGHPDEARAWLAAARRDDFAAGGEGEGVLVLDGWVLARAEAEVLTLAAALAG